MSKGFNDWLDQRFGRGASERPDNSSSVMGHELTITTLRDAFGAGREDVIAKMRRLVAGAEGATPLTGQPEKGR